MPKDVSAVFRSQLGNQTPVDTQIGLLERLSAVETLKGLQEPEKVTLGDLVRFLSAKGLWNQFAKITLGDLRQAFAEPESALVEEEPSPRKRKRKIMAETLELAGEEPREAPASEAVSDGGLSSDEVARLVMPFIEGNGDVTLDDIEEYSRLDRKVLRYHLGALVKEGRLERIGVGRHAVYSSL